jgi:hypothetical protein
MSWWHGQLRRGEWEFDIVPKMSRITDTEAELRSRESALSVAQYTYA